MTGLAWFTWIVLIIVTIRSWQIHIKYRAAVRENLELRILANEQLAEYAMFRAEFRNYLEIHDPENLPIVDGFEPTENVVRLNR